MAPITRSARKPSSTSATFPQESWSFPQPRAPFAQSVREEPEEDEPDPDDVFNDDLGMEDGVQTTEDEIQTGDDEDAEVDDPSEARGDTEDAAPQPMSHADLQEALSPLHNVADRVWKQVEEFAKNLDRFNPSGEGRHDAQNWKDACKLVEKYKIIAQDNLRRAENDRKLGRSPSGSRHDGRHHGSGRLSSDKKPDDDTARCRREVDTWDILGTLLGMDDPWSHHDSVHARAHTLKSLHRYATDYDIWESFLTSDHFAKECVAILKWLQSTADASRDSVESYIRQLENEAERGEGLWASGWLYTKEEIKKAKRLRAWPKVIEPETPGIEETFKNKENEPLVTQLDPDATSRQGRALYKEDSTHEKAMWLASWELLRRGKSWDDIRQWFQDQGEGWRALSLRGANVNSASDAAAEEARHGLSRMMNYQMLSIWRQSCYEISKGHAYTQGLEEAVYGVLCGHTEAATKACRTVDDHLFVHYNSMIIERHRTFAGVVNTLIEEPREESASFLPNVPTYDTVRNYLNHARQDPKMEQECSDPFRMIQATIMAKDYRKLFVRQGQALNQLANKTRKSKLFLGSATDLIDQFATKAAEDSDALRVLAHLFLITKALGYEDSSDPDIGVMEDNLVGYIAFLQQAGKLELMPLYASRLSEARQHRVLGQMLVDVTNRTERGLQIKLMKQYNIDIASVLRSQFESNLQDANTVLDTSAPSFNVVDILEESTMTWDYLKARSDFMDGEIGPEDELLIRSMEWHLYLHGHWAQVCSFAATLYKRFLALGHLTAARELHQRVLLSDLSSANTGFDLSSSPFSSEVVTEDEAEERPTPRRTRSNQSPKKSRPRRRSTDEKLPSPNREQLYQEAQTWRELEQLVKIFDLLEMWSDQSTKVLASLGTKSNATDKLRKGLQPLFIEIGDAFNMLLGDWLIHPQDEQEAAVLEKIRITYLPQVILAFNSVLNIAGHVISRDYLVQCMELATQVATNANLTQACVAAKRTRDLAKSFAVSAKTMLYVKEGDSKKKKKSSKVPAGANMEIWQVKPKDVGIR